MTGPEVARKPTPSSRADDLRQRGLAEAGRADEQHVVQRLAALARRLDEDREVLARLRLADEFGQRLRAQRGVADIIGAALGRDDAGRRGHAGRNTVSVRRKGWEETTRLRRSSALFCEGHRF